MSIIYNRATVANTNNTTSIIIKNLHTISESKKYDATNTLRNYRDLVYMTNLEIKMTYSPTGGISDTQSILSSIGVDPYNRDVTLFYGSTGYQQATGGIIPTGFQTDFTTWLKIMDPSTVKADNPTTWGYINGNNTIDQENKTNMKNNIDPTFIPTGYVSSNPNTHPNIPLFVNMRQDLVNAINNKLNHLEQNLTFNTINPSSLGIVNQI